MDFERRALLLLKTWYTHTATQRLRLSAFPLHSGRVVWRWCDEWKWRNANFKQWWRAKWFEANQMLLCCEKILTKMTLFRCDTLLISIVYKVSLLNVFLATDIQRGPAVVRELCFLSALVSLVSSSTVCLYRMLNIPRVRYSPGCSGEESDKIVQSFCVKPKGKKNVHLCTLSSPLLLFRLIWISRLRLYKKSWMATRDMHSEVRMNVYF